MQFSSNLLMARVLAFGIAGSVARFTVAFADKVGAYLGIIGSKLRNAALGAVGICGVANVPDVGE
jgi:hypothetical protein